MIVAKRGGEGTASAKTAFGPSCCMMSARRVCPESMTDSTHTRAIPRKARKEQAEERILERPEKPFQKETDGRFVLYDFFFACVTRIV